MMAYPGQTLTWTMLGQLCAALWNAQSRLVMIQPCTKVCSGAYSTEMQCLRPLRHSGYLRDDVYILKVTYLENLIADKQNILGLCQQWTNKTKTKKIVLGWNCPISTFM